MAGSRLVLPSQQPEQSTGLPYADGQLFFYLTGTSTPTPTYQDAGLTIPNTNPVVLDSSGNVGNVFLNPSIIYKVVLEDANNNQIWTYDPVNPFALGSILGLNIVGTSGGSANAQIVSGPTSQQNGQVVIFTAGFTNTGPATFNTGFGALPFYKPTSIGPALLSGSEIVVGATYLAIDVQSLNSNNGGWQLIAPSKLTDLGVSSAVATALLAATTPLVYAALGGAISAPNGRLTLTSGTPFLSSTVTAATSVLFTPYNGNQAPLWNGSEWLLQPFSEVADLLSSTTYSPLAAVAGTVYDEFLFQSAGTWALSRVAWTNSTTRANALTRVNGFLTNSTSITNGPLAGYGLYVGTVMTDISAATVTFAPQPPAASGGPMTGSGGGNPGAWVGLWNEYNRTTVTSTAQDNKASWSANTSGAFVTLDSSTSNRITFVSGGSEDSVNVFFALGFGATNGGTAGIGINSTSITTGITPSAGPYTSVQAVANIIEPLGVTYAQALQQSSTSVTFYGFPISQLSAQLRY